MRRLVTASILACLLLVPAWGAPNSVSMPSFWRYAHPDSKALIGIEWQRLVNSPIGQEIRQKIQEQNQDQQDWTGSELIDQVGRIFISSPGNADGSMEQQPPAVIAVQGTFDLAQVREMAAEKAAESFEYESVEILEQAEPTKPGGRPMALALVSPQLLLLGDMESIQLAIDHYNAGDPSQVSNPLFVRASELAGANDIWIVSDASPSDFSADGMQQAQFLNNVKSIEAGISLQSGLGLELNLGTESNRSALELAAGLQFMAGMFFSSAAQKPGMPNLVEKLQITTDQSLVRMALALNRQELEQSFGQLKESMQPSVGGQGTDIALRSVEGSGDWNWGEAQRRPEPKPGKQVITIWGLEEGKREVPVQ